jgi:hypothetical protein
VKPILTTTDRVLVESVRVALEADGIDVVVEGDAVTALPFIPLTVLVSDADTTQAQNVVRDLNATPAVQSEGWRRRSARLALVALLILLIIACGELLIG